MAAVTSALVSIVQNIDGSGNTDRRVSPGELFAVILTSLTKGERVLELLKLLNATIQYVPPPLVKANVKALLKLTDLSTQLVKSKTAAASKDPLEQTLNLMMA